ncbi:MAG: carboxypeptidase regulatory-like domain-containing protein, partial [Planctomycetota bacterium]
ATADFGVEAHGRASIWTFCNFGLGEGEQFVAGCTDIRIVLPPEARIKGRVVDEHKDQAIDGVSIQAAPYNDRVGWNFRKVSVQTDPNGRFVLTGLAPNKYLLRVISDKAGSGHLSVTVEAGQTIRDVQINLIKGVPLEVIVHDAEKGGPLEDADVDVTQYSDTPPYSMFEKRATSDANGLARLHVLPGEYEVKIFKPDYGITFQPQKVHLQPEQTLRHEVSLSRSAIVLSGEILDEKGQAVSGVSVMQTSFGPRTITDANGHFDTSDTHYFRSRLPSKVTMLARHIQSGLAAIGEFQDPTRSGKFHGRIILKPAYVLSGSVTDPTGKSIPAAYVKLLLEGPATGAHSRPLAEVITDANGVYSISSVPPPLDDLNNAYVIAAYTEGFGITMVRQIPFHNDTSKPVYIDPIVLQSASEVISGVVTDSNDQPVGDVLISVYGPRLSERYGQAPCAKTLTDAQGRFRITGMCKESLKIQAWLRSSKQRGSTMVNGGNENVRVVLGQNLIFSPSLIGKPLPDLKDLKVDLSPADADYKMMLVCFFDMEQRPSRNCIIQLAKRAQEFKIKDIVVVAVQTTKIDENALNEWITKYNIPFNVGTVRDDIEKNSFAWGVRSLPWLILTDQQHIIHTEGFALSELDEKIGAATKK